MAPPRHSSRDGGGGGASYSSADWGGSSRMDAPLSSRMDSTMSSRMDAPMSSMLDQQYGASLTSSSSSLRASCAPPAFLASEAGDDGLARALAYDPLSDPAILASFDPLAREGPASGRGDAAASGGGPPVERLERLDQTRRRPTGDLVLRGRGESGPGRLARIRLDLLSTTAAAQPVSRLDLPLPRQRGGQDGPDPQQQAQALPDFEAGFADAVAKVRQSMGVLDQAGRSMAAHWRDHLARQQGLRSRDLDRSLSVLDRNLVESRVRLRHAAVGWQHDVEQGQRAMQRGFDQAAGNARAALAARHELYNRDIGPVTRRRTDLMAGMISDRDGLKRAADDARDTMGDLGRNPTSFAVPPVSSDGGAEQAGGEALQESIAEAVHAFLPSRAEFINSQIDESFERLNQGLLEGFRCIPCTVDSGFIEIAGFVQQVSVLGPRAVDELAGTARNNLQEATASLQDAITDAFGNVDASLLANHTTSRENLITAARREQQAEADQAMARGQAGIDRLEASRDALPRAVEDVRSTMITLAAQAIMPDAELAQKVMTASETLAQQAAKLAAREPDAARAVTQRFERQLAIALAEQGLVRQDQLRVALRHRRDQLHDTGQQIEHQLAMAMAELQPFVGQFAKTAQSFLPPVKESFGQALTNLGRTLDDAENARARAMGRNEAAPGPTPGPSPTPTPTPGGPQVQPASCNGCGPNSSTMPAEEPLMSVDRSTSDPAGESPGDNVCVDVMTPLRYQRQLEDWVRDPGLHEEIAKLLRDARNNVPRVLIQKYTTISDEMGSILSADVPKVVETVEGITAANGRYFETRFGGAGALRERFRAWANNELGFEETANQEINAFNASLDGRSTDAAIARLRTALVGWNDTTMLDNVMNNLTPPQIAALRAAPPGTLDELRAGMDSEERARFNAMLAGRPGEARAQALKTSIDDIRSEYGLTETGGEKTRDAIRTAGEAAGNWAAEGDRNREMRDIFGLDLPSAARTRREEAWRDTQVAFGSLPGVADRLSAGGSTDMAGSALLDYATRGPAAWRMQVYNQQTGEYETVDRQPQYYNYETGRYEPMAFNAGHRRTTEMMLRHGISSDEAAGAELYTEMHRPFGGRPRPEAMMRLLQPAEANAVEMGGYNAAARAEGLAQAEQRRTNIFRLYEENRVASEGGDIRPAKEVREALSAQLQTAFRGDENAQAMMRGFMDNARGDPLATMEYALAHENFDVARNQLARMDRTEIDRMLARWDPAKHGGRSFEEVMGIGAHRFNATDFILPVLLGGTGMAINQARGANYNWGAAYSGDEANELEILMNGVPQNEFEAGHVAQRVMQQQVDQSTLAGRVLAWREHDRLVENANALRNMMGTGDVALDSMGRIRATDPITGQPVVGGNFHPDGTFRPPVGTTAGDFSVAMGLARFHADNYKQAVDRVATYIATAIVLTAAIATTFLTGGAAASIWIPMLVTMGAGVLAMGTTAMIKGSRYSKDQMLTDLATNIVSAATAGLASGAGVWLRAGGGAAGSAALGRLAGSWRVSEEALALAARGATVADDVAVAGAKTAATAANLADDAAGIAARGAGSAAGVADDAALAATRGAGAADEVAQLGKMSLGQTMAIGGISSGLSSATGAAMDRRNRQAEDYWSRVFKAFGRGFSGGAAGAGVTHGVMGLGDIERIKPFQMVLRGVSGAASGATSKGVEMQYENLFMGMRHSRASMGEEMFLAGLQSALQNVGEGWAEARAGNYREANLPGSGPGGRRPPAEGDTPGATLLRDDDLPPSPLPRAANDNDDGVIIPPVVAPHPPVDAAIPPTAPAARPVSAPAEIGDQATGPARGGVDDDDNVMLPSLAHDPEGFAAIAATMRTARQDDTPETRSAPPRDAADIATERGPAAPQLGAAGAALAESGTAGAPARSGPPPAPRNMEQHIMARDGSDRPVYANNVDFDRMDLRIIPEFPPGSRFTGPDPYDRGTAERNFEILRARDPNREVALLRNADTGEYRVMQGSADRVKTPGLPWMVDAHSHPRIINAELNQQLAISLPTAAGLDMSVLKRELDHLAIGAPPGAVITRSAKIVGMANGVAFETTYGAFRQGNEYRFYAEFSDPVTGARKTVTRNSIAEYDAWAFRLTGIEMSDATWKAMGLASGVHPGSLDAAVQRVTHDTPLHDSERQRIGGFQQDQDALVSFGRNLAEQGADARASADAHLQALGLVGRADSPVRLHRIINDLSIPFDTRRAVAMRVRDLTEVHMRAVGALGPNEPLYLFFHGEQAPVRHALAYRDQAGPGEDFERGLYATQDLASAYLYDGRHPTQIAPGIKANGRGPRGDAAGEVVPFFVPGKELGVVVDVGPGGPHEQAWRNFLDGTPRTYPPDNSSFPGMFDRFPTTRDYLTSIWGNRDFNEGRGRVFQHFLENTPGLPLRPDIVLGELGGFLTSGIQLSDRVTDQAAIRSQRILDHFNAQHGYETIGARSAVRWPPAAGAEPVPQMGSVVRPKADGGPAATPEAGPDPLEHLRLLGSHVFGGARRLRAFVREPDPVKRASLRAEFEHALPMYVLKPELRQQLIAAAVRLEAEHGEAIRAAAKADVPANVPPATAEASPAPNRADTRELANAVKRATARLAEIDPLLSRPTRQQMKDPGFLAKVAATVGSYRAGRIRVQLHADLKELGQMLGSAAGGNDARRTAAVERLNATMREYGLHSEIERLIKLPANAGADEVVQAVEALIRRVETLDAADGLTGPDRWNPRDSTPAEDDLRAMAGVSVMEEGQGTTRFGGDDDVPIYSTVRDGTLNPAFDDGIDPESGQRICDFLREIHGLSEDRNIALAQFEGPEGTQFLMSKSGRNDVPEGMVERPDNPLFKVHENPAMPNDFHTEPVILEQIARGLPIEASGKLVLYTERDACASCRHVFEQFAARFPNITIVVTWRDGTALTYR